MPTLMEALPPGPKPKYPGQWLVEVGRNPISFLGWMKKEFGDVVHFRLGPAKVFLVSHPDHIQEVLSTQSQNFMKGTGLQWAKRLLGDGLIVSEGDTHHRQRRMIQPSFHRQRIATYAEAMVQCASKLQESWKDKQELNMSDQMMRLTLQVVGKTLLNVDMEEQITEISLALTECINVLKKRLFWPYTAWVEALPIPSNLRMDRASRRLKGIVEGIIREHKKIGGDQMDLLSTLLASRDSEQDGTGMTDEQVRDEAINLLLAGYETTANALTWMWYLLSQNPGVGEKLHKEVDQVLHGRLPTVEDIPNLSYTEKVFAEALRVYPPVWVLGYQALRECQIGGYQIPKNGQIVMCQYLVHRDSRYYSDPEQFQPERWTSEFKASRPRFAYFPFGGGPRQCIGEPFAWMEGVLLTATLAQKWKFNLKAGHPVELYPSITLRPKHGMKMVLEERK
jgi:cytochrome P450